MTDKKKRKNGSGSVYLRKDGRYGAAKFVDVPGEGRKRINAYGKSAREATTKLNRIIHDLEQGRPARTKDWTLRAFLVHWLENVVAIKNRPRTYESYESVVRRFLIPGLGRFRLHELTVHDVQALINKQHRDGVSPRMINMTRSVLRTALSRAEREEIVSRNVAKLVDVPSWQRKPIVPWAPDEATTFLQAAQDHPWYTAYAMLLIFGMRRGEVLGLRWCDIDFERQTIHVRQQLQRIHGKLEQVPVKTSAGVRDLPLVSHLHAKLAAAHQALPAHQHTTAETDAIDRQLVFLSAVGTPIDPKNFVRTFHQIREGAGLQRITVHHTRHTAATALKDFDMPVRDAQLILGHSHVTTTMQHYQHGTSSRQRDAMEKITKLIIQ
jgi:integrase